MKQLPLLVLVVILVVGVLAIAFRRTGDGPATLAENAEEEVFTLKGAVQFGEEHAFTRTIRKFEDLVREYYGKPVNLELYINSELGLEKDYFAYMSQGISVDYGIVSPAHMSTFSEAAPLMDMPFLFRNVTHWNQVLESNALDPIAEQVAEKADVRLIGYAGGGVRNLIVNKPVRNLEELQGLSMRVMGAPIQTRIFQAIGAAPSVIAYSEVYNAIQTGVIDAAENEAAGLQQMKFYEVGPEISQTQHAITVRPLCFSAKTLRRLPSDLQAAVLRAGREAGAFGRELESTEDAAILEKLASEGRLRVHKFRDREAILKLAEPVKAAYAREIKAEKVLARINALE